MFVHVKRDYDFLGYQSDGFVGLSLASNDEAELLIDVLYDIGAISKREFLLYIGKNGVDDSYIEFGEFGEDKAKGTVLDVKPDPKSGSYYFWKVGLDSLHYKNTTQELSTNDTVLNTGYSTIGFPAVDYVKIISSIANGRKLNYMPGGGPWYDCDGINDNNGDLHFKFVDKEVIVSHHEFIKYFNGRCIIHLTNLGDSDYIVLGTSFLRGSRILHDYENKQIVLFEQRVYDYSEEGSSFTWFWVLLGFIGALNICMIAFCVWKKQDKNSQDQVYARIHQRINYA